MPISILVSGATGFVGSAVLAGAAARGMTAGALVRRHDGEYEPAALHKGLRGVDCIVHCAGRAHIMTDVSPDPLEAFRTSNVTRTLALARAAAAAGVRRFVFISSIKVNGECTASGAPFLPTDPPRPADPYGVSKHEAEQALRQLSAETGLEVVVIRPVLVYGPGVKANFLAMMRWLTRRVPLPFGLIDNRRSLVGLDNLVDLILTTVDHPNAAGQTFLVSDDEDVSTPELLTRTAAALGTSARLVPVSPAFLCGLAGLVGKRAAASRLCGSLQVDLRHTKTTLGWSPPASVDSELARTARHFLSLEAG